MRKKLPIGIQSFQKMREADYYYVDKTGFALQLIDQGTYYFLSRPRRFGKSLFLDTLKELFEANEPLFRGLYVHDKWDWQVKHPVIMLSFADGILKSAAELKERIIEQLRFHQQTMGVRCESASVAGSFAELIRKTHQKFGQRVVVLVDEYDKPILDNIEEPETAREMREGLRDVYSVIKGGDAHIRFTFLTGVSKFSKVSLFSGLNNLEDITIDNRYSAICGYTDTDVDTVFGPELGGLDRNEIRKWYNGYNWTGASVYNPFDLLLLFRKREFRPWWFETGTPTFLVNYLLEKKFFTPDLAGLRGSMTLLSSFDVGQIEPEALLFQTGYLTIRKVEEPIRGQWVYTLSYPNYEVEAALNSILLAGCLGDERNSFDIRLRLLDVLNANDFPGLRDLFHSFFASIPHDWYRKNQLSGYEGYYASIFYSYFAALGLDIVVEDSTNKGRIDMTVRFNGHVYLFEFKVVEMIPEGKALEQLKARGYAEKYRSSGEPLHLIGVEFSRESRNIVAFEVEEG